MHLPPLPEPQKGRPSIIPFFIPFAGCRQRCLFCDQHSQSGQPAAPLAARLAQLATTLGSAHQEPAPELAFYGGTFTAIPDNDFHSCVKLVNNAYTRGFICTARASTRPDATDAARLQQMRAAGFSLLELGVQSFSDTALHQAQRGYSGATARAACHAVRAVGLECGIQLMPGMPGVTPEIFLADVDTALNLHPSCLRFYPCLVLRGTALEKLWQEGGYQPWSLDCTVQTLGKALAKAWAAGVPVIRMGLAPEAGMDEAVVAGPRHPALGSLIQGEALLEVVGRAIAEMPPGQRGALRGGAQELAAHLTPSLELHLPAWTQGFALGHRGHLRPRWLELGIDPSQIRWVRAFHA